MITGNKGEWSEIYTLLKILADKNIVAGDKNLNEVENIIFPVIKILRNETNGSFEFSYDNDIVIIKHKKECFRIGVNIFATQAKLLLNKLKTSTDRTFEIPEIENFINSFNCKSIKANSSTKTDIRIIIHDTRRATQTELGFSIKSQLGSPSTLLNAGKTTNFIYAVDGNLSQKEIQNINSLTIQKGTKKSADIKKRVTSIYNHNCKLIFEKTEQKIFSNNLILIDSLLPVILSNILLDFYTNKISHLSDLVNNIEKINPLNFDTRNGHKYYEYKIKKFLSDVALGMMPSKTWTGDYDATGGYLIVKEDGKILCYHIYDRNKFEDYLLYNTKLETASSSRHNFGELYTENNKLKFKLNLQIRFIN